MSDPLSVIAGIVGIAATATELAITLYDMADRLKNFKADALRIAQDMTSLSTILEKLGEVLRQGQGVYKSGVLDQANDIQARFKGVQGKVTKLTQNCGKMRARLRWVLNSDKVRELLNDIESLKSTMNLILWTIQLAMAQKGDHKDAKKGTRLRALVESIVKQNRENIISMQEWHATRYTARNTSPRSHNHAVAGDNLFTPKDNRGFTRKEHEDLLRDEIWGFRPDGTPPKESAVPTPDERDYYSQAAVQLYRLTFAPNESDPEPISQVDNDQLDPNGRTGPIIRSRHGSEAEISKRDHNRVPNMQLIRLPPANTLRQIPMPTTVANLLTAWTVLKPNEISAIAGKEHDGSKYEPEPPRRRDSSPNSEMEFLELPHPKAEAQRRSAAHGSPRRQPPPPPPPERLYDSPDPDEDAGRREFMKMLDMKQKLANLVLRQAEAKLAGDHQTAADLQYYVIPDLKEKIIRLEERNLHREYLAERRKFKYHEGELHNSDMPEVRYESRVKDHYWDADDSARQTPPEPDQEYIRMERIKEVEARFEREREEDARLDREREARIRELKREVELDLREKEKEQRKKERILKEEFSIAHKLLETVFGSRALLSQKTYKSTFPGLLRIGYGDAFLAYETLDRMRISYGEPTCSEGSIWLTRIPARLGSQSSSEPPSVGSATSLDQSGESHYFKYGVLFPSTNVNAETAQILTLRTSLHEHDVETLFETQQDRSRDEPIWMMTAKSTPNLISGSMMWNSSAVHGGSELFHAMSNRGWQPLYVRGCDAGQTWFYGTDAVHVRFIRPDYVPQLDDINHGMDDTYLLVGIELVEEDALRLEGIEYKLLLSGFWMLDPSTTYSTILSLVATSFMLREAGLRRSAKKEILAPMTTKARLRNGDITLVSDSIPLGLIPRGLTSASQHERK